MSEFANSGAKHTWGDSGWLCALQAKRSRHWYLRRMFWREAEKIPWVLRIRPSNSRPSPCVDDGKWSRKSIEGLKSARPTPGHDHRSVLSWILDHFDILCQLRTAVQRQRAATENMPADYSVFVDSIRRLPLHRVSFPAYGVRRSHTTV